jgi:phosphoribosylformylglycinamidine synthase
MQLLEETELHNAVLALADARLIHSACDISDGGLAVALAKACFENEIGVSIRLNEYSPRLESRELFGEDSSLILVTCAPESLAELKRALDDFGSVSAQEIGFTVTTDQIDGDPDFEIAFGDEVAAIRARVADLKEAHTKSLESQLAEEVLA